MATFDTRPAKRRSDIRSAVNELLSLRMRYGKAAIREAVQMADRSELQVCGMCGDWTCHQNGKCQQCADFGLPPIPKDFYRQQ